MWFIFRPYRKRNANGLLIVGVILSCLTALYLKIDSYVLEFFVYLCQLEECLGGKSMISVILQVIVMLPFAQLKMINMKRLILPFLIFTVSSFGAVASEFNKLIVQNPDSLIVVDSLELFRNVTDISRQIEQRTAKSNASASFQQNTQGTAPSDLSGSVEIPPQPKMTVNIDSILPTETTQLPPDTVIFIPIDSTLYRNPLDSLYFRKENGTLQLPLDPSSFDAMTGLSFRDTLFYNPLFLPMIFTGDILPRDLSLYTPEKREENLLIPRERTFQPKLDHFDFVRNVRRDYYADYPDRMRYSVASFDSIPNSLPDDRAVMETANPFRDLIRTETTFSLDAPGVEGVTIRRKYWMRSGEHSFQFAQNYFSKNWHRGGTNNLNFNSVQILRANYRKEKVRFNNTFEWRLTVFNAPDDSLRQYRIGNDLIRYYGDFGVDAFGKGWSYSTNLEAKSQLFNAYPMNSTNLLSSLFSPLYANAGVGLKYILDKPSKTVRHRKFRWELALAPVSLNMKYVMNDDVDVQRFGIEEGKKVQIDLGSTLTSIMRYDITRYISWDSRLTYFTSYEKVISEFENGLNMSLSNAFSTRIYVMMRYDDGVPPDAKLKHLQLNQTLSFGLNYKW